MRLSGVVRHRWQESYKDVRLSQARFGAVEGRNPLYAAALGGNCAAGLTRKCLLCRIYAEIAFATPATSLGFARVKIFFQKSEHDPVHPLAVSEIRLPFDSFADEAHALRVPNGAIVEAVALELKTMEAEVVQQVPLELPRGLVRKPASAEIRVRREASEIRDLAALVPDVESHGARAFPVLSLRRFDHEPAGLERLALGTLDLLQQRLTVARPAPDMNGSMSSWFASSSEEIEIVNRRPADANVHSGTGAGRRVQATSPEPRATPPRMSPSPTSFWGVRDSSRRVAPYTRANGGSR